MKNDKNKKSIKVFESFDLDSTGLKDSPKSVFGL
jgi:hypothetical protein